jgi:hypothetical protein
MRAGCWWVVAWTACCALGAAAQEEESLDEMVVTGTRISMDDLSDIPPIAIQRPGDELVLDIVLRNDTRDETARLSELHATVLELVRSGSGRVEVRYAAADGAIVLDRDNYRVEAEEDSEREDASMLELRLRTAVRAGVAGNAQTSAMREFARKAKVHGRTEVDANGEIAVTLKQPEKYRRELLEAIAAEVRQVQGVFGPTCRIDVSGLDSRVEWRRASATELLLFLPYSFDLSECHGNGAAAP